MIIRQNIKLSDNNEKIIRNILIVFDLFILVVALSTGASTMFEGMGNIINHSSALVADYMVIGGISAAFFNTFLVTTLGIALLLISKVHLNGVSFAAIFMLSGFSLFGKNIMNVIPIMLGVIIYALIFKRRLSKVVYAALFGTALGPIVTEIFIQMNQPVIVNLLVSYLAGIFIGFILPPVSECVLSAHKGFDLYNIGFTDGFVSICLLSFLKICGFGATPNSMNEHINDNLFLGFLIGFSLILIIVGIFFDHDVIKGQKNINKESGKGQVDFIFREGIGATLTNMGLCCLLSTLFMYFVGAPLNGPIYGTIISITGFCACGDNLRNISFIYIASLIGHLTGLWNIADSVGIALATLLGTGLAPIGGYYGMIPGIISGFVHISLAQFTSPLHLGLNLYNNGFVAGIVAMFLVPIFESFVKLKRKLVIYKNFIHKGESDNGSIE